MDRVDFISLYFNSIDRTKIKPSDVGREFTSFLLEEFLKESFKPILENKNFTQRMYWEQFLTTVSEALSTKDPLKLEEEFKKTFSCQSQTKISR